MKAKGDVVIFDRDMGHAAFVSHQRLGFILFFLAVLEFLGTLQGPLRPVASRS